jgi:hypothetical protein
LGVRSSNRFILSNKLPDQHPITARCPLPADYCLPPATYNLPPTTCN